MKAADILGPDGPLAHRLPSYEPRPAQVSYARAVERAIRNERHLLIEGPCGTGKSLGYLIPAILSGRRVVVATANIALQEQLVGSDLPFLRETLGGVLDHPLTFALVKGKGNFLCRDRYARAVARGVEGIDSLKEWAQDSPTGDISELDVEMPSRLRAAVCGNQEDCAGDACAEAECWAYQARDRAQEADVIVCNYHVLFAHLSVGRTLLPEFDVLICDEAHEMADVARGFFGWTVRPWTLKSLSGDKIFRHDVDRLFTKLDGLRRSGRYRGRLREEIAEEIAGWPEVEKVQGHLSRLIARREEDLAEAIGRDSKRKARRELEKARNAEARLDAGTGLYDEASWVYWLEEAERGRAALCGMPTEPGGYLRRELWDHPGLRAAILTSATLTTQGSSFDYIERETGLDETRREIDEEIVPSPFDFRRQALLYLPPMKALPNAREFAGEVGRRLADLIDIHSGGVLALFASYRNMHAVREVLDGELDVEETPILMQGEAPRSKLVERFRADEAASLLGTASFWTGVDAPGRTLRCVTIDKVPFAPPDDPLGSWMSDQDKSAFVKFTVPRAIIAVRQGYGRLIRRRGDRGVVVMFDRRIEEKFYGRMLMASLPESRVTRKIGKVERWTEEAEAGAGQSPPMTGS